VFDANQEDAVVGERRDNTKITLGIRSSEPPIHPTSPGSRVTDHRAGRYEPVPVDEDNFTLTSQDLEGHDEQKFFHRTAPGTTARSLSSYRGSVPATSRAPWSIPVDALCRERRSESWATGTALHVLYTRTPTATTMRMSPTLKTS
jgi:hypothetical protein